MNHWQCSILKLSQATPDFNPSSSPPWFHLGWFLSISPPPAQLVILQLATLIKFRFRLSSGNHSVTLMLVLEDTLLRQIMRGNAHGKQRSIILDQSELLPPKTDRSPSLLPFQTFVTFEAVRNYLMPSTQWCRHPSILTFHICVNLSHRTFSMCFRTTMEWEILRIYKVLL